METKLWLLLMKNVKRCMKQQTIIIQIEYLFKNSRSKSVLRLEKKVCSWHFIIFLSLSLSLCKWTDGLRLQFACTFTFHPYTVQPQKMGKHCEVVRVVIVGPLCFDSYTVSSLKAVGHRHNYSFCIMVSSVVFFSACSPGLVYLGPNAGKPKLPPLFHR